MQYHCGLKVWLSVTNRRLKWVGLRTGLLNRPGRTALNSLGTDGSGFTNVTFDDGAGNGDVHNYEETLGIGFDSGGTLTGTWAPDGRNVDPTNVLDTDSRTALLGSFDGQVPNGNWTLFVADVAGGGTLMLSDWSIDITVSRGPEPHHALVVALGLGWFAVKRRWVTRSATVAR